MTNDCKTCPVSTGTHKPAEALHQQIDEPALQALRERMQFTHARLGHAERFVEAPAAVAAEVIKLADRQHARIAELESQVDAIGAGGVEPLRKPAAAPQEVPEQSVPVGYVALAALTSRTHADDYAPCFATEAALIENYPAAKVIAVYDHAATQPAAQGMDGREFPPLTPELASILGLMCFQCISFAQALRAAGRQIATRAEDEQAAVLHWMLGHYFRHGEDWRTAAAEDMERMKAAARAAQAKQGGAA